MHLTSIVSAAALVALVLLATIDPAWAIPNNGTHPTPIPEPDTLSLLAVGAVGLAYLVRKRRK